MNHINYREIKSGSILRQIRAYNNRTDVTLTGEFKLISPRPFGESCSDFVNICRSANRLPENRLRLYKPEEILTYNPASNADINPLNAHELCLVDFYLRDTNRLEIEYTVDASQNGYEPCTLALPFMYIQLLQFTVIARVGNIFTQKLAVAFSRHGAIIYEISKYVDEFPIVYRQT